MQLRIFTEPQQGASYDDLLRVAKATEDLGFDAFFRSDHYLSMGSGDGLPGPTDAWISLAGLARETSRIKLGTLVSPVTFRLPGPLAISVAQIDVMSGGRAELGLGAGWFAAEHEAYGIPFPGTAERFDRFAEQVEIIRGLLTTPAGSTFSFDGTYYSLADSPALPKPVQSPLPIVLGGEGRRRSAQLAARFADEYNVNFKSVEDSREVVERVRDAAAAAGRELVYSAAQTMCVGKDDADLARRAAAIGRPLDDLRRTGIAGTPGEVVDKLGAFASIGVSRVYLQTLDLDDLDHLELVANEVLAQV
jgi:F420-dependent oxidoreductase-like protein